MSLSMPMTCHPSRQSRRTHSEPIRPPEPVTNAFIFVSLSKLPPRLGVSVHRIQEAAMMNGVLSRYLVRTDWLSSVVKRESMDAIQTRSPRMPQELNSLSVNG